MARTAASGADLRLDRAAGVLLRGGLAFDPDRRCWTAMGTGAGAGEPVAPADAVAWLQRESGAPCRVPVGVVGGREAEEEQLAAAEAVGAALAEMGLTLACGGRGGVMQAACRGAVGRGGVTLGLLPDDDWRAANPYVTIPVATGLGVARNAVVARACLALVAVGGGYGTTSEVAFALQFGRPVVGLAGAPRLDGVRHLEAPADAAEAVARVVLALPLDG